MFNTEHIQLKTLSKEVQAPLIVEFVGLPGAGKTTVAYKVAEKLCSQEVHIISRSEIISQWHQINGLRKIFRLFPLDANHWQVLTHALKLSLQVAPTTWWSIIQAAKVFSNVKRNDDVVQDRNYQVLLLDQGPLQEVWSILLKGELSQKKLLEKAVSPIFKERRISVVHSKVAMKTALGRIQGRPRKLECPFDQMEKDKAYTSLLQYSPYLQEIVTYAQASGAPVLEVDSASPVEQQATEISNWIIQQLEH